jgi:hypothetical protein
MKSSADPITGFSKRRNHGRNGNNSVARKGFTQEADAPDIFVTVLSAIAEALRQMRPYYIAIENLYPELLQSKLFGEESRHRSLATSRHAGKPYSEALTHQGILPGLIRFAAKRRVGTGRI